MNTELLLLVLVGGVPVILSYMWYGWWSDSSFSFEDIQGGLVEWKLSAWYVSVLLVVLSYIYMLIEFVANPLTDAQKNILYPSYMLFLSSASQYTLYTTVDLVNARKSNMLLVNLLLVALGALGFLITAIISENALLIVATSWVLFHHLAIDAGYWYYSFDPGRSILY